MKKIILLVCTASCIMLSCNNASKEAQPPTDTVSTYPAIEIKPEAPPVAIPDSAAIDSLWKNFKTAGDMHKWMEKTNGSWDVDLSVWMDPSAPPEKSKATIVQTSTLGGRYVVGKFSGTLFKMPFEGMSTMGYDNAKKLFVSTWIDNQGTGIVYMSGNYDDKTKTLNLSGYQTDFMTGKDTNIREELTIIDGDSYIMTMFGPGMDGKEMKMMQGTYKRKK